MPPDQNMDDNETVEILAAITAKLQNNDTRITQTETVFGKSLIIPPDKVNAILLTFVSVIFILCCLFAFIWFLDRPI